MIFQEIRLIIVRYSNENQDKAFEHYLCAKGDIGTKLCRDQMLEQYGVYLADAMAEEAQDKPELGNWHGSVFKANPDIFREHLEKRYYSGTYTQVTYEEKLVNYAE